MLTTAVVLAIAAAVGLFLYLLSSSAGPLPGSSTVNMDAYGQTTGQSPDESSASGATATAAASKEIEQEDFETLLVGEITPSQVIEKELFFDINGDSAEEALILVRDAGERRPLDIFLFEMKGGRPQVTFRLVGVARGEAVLEGSQLLLTEAVYAQGDAPCCPSTTIRLNYTYKDGTLVKS